AFSQQHGALDDVRLVDDAPVFHVVSPCHVAEPDFGTLDHVRDVPHPESSSGFCGEHGLLDVMHVIEETKRANVHLLEAHFHKAATGVDVVVGELLLYLTDTHSIRHQLVRIYAHLVLSHRAAEVRNVDD